MSINLGFRIACAEGGGCLAWFRLFVGDLSNDVSDDVLTNAFNKYTSFTKARVIRDRLSQKVSVIPSLLCNILMSQFPGKIRFRRFLRPRGLLESLERDGW